jgi:endonuclease/exonuclease/phosphatase family metal-dependent hydrolase
VDYKVLTFNIHHGIGVDKKLDLNRIAQLLNSLDADIIGINEVDRFFSKRSDFEDQARFLAKELNYEHIFGPAVTMEAKDRKEARQFGNALLTRLPIIDSKNYPFDFLPKVIEDRALLEVKLDTGGRELTVFVTHLSLALFQHRKQSSFILHKIRAVEGPALVMGDWNMTPASRTWKDVNEQLKDVWMDVQSGISGGHTFPSRRPFRRLDYIFINQYLEAVSCEVVTSKREVSDHLPFMGTVRYADRGNDFTKNQNESYY